FFKLCILVGVFKGLGCHRALHSFPTRRSSDLIAARLARRRLGDEETASLLMRALDCLFAAGEPPAEQRELCMRAFADLEEVLRNQGALKELERAYRAMIRRLGASAPELPELWTRLGALYRDELGQPQAAAESYEVAAALDRDESSRARILIDV